MAESRITRPNASYTLFGSNVAVSGNGAVLVVAYTTVSGNTPFIVTFDVSGGVVTYRSSGDISGLTTTAGTGIALNYDGSVLYIGDINGNGTVKRYVYTTTWALNATLPAQVTFSQNSYGSSIVVNIDDTKLWIGDADANDMLFNQGYAHLVNRTSAGFFISDVLGDPTVTGDGNWFATTLAALPDFSLIAIGHKGFNASRGKVSYFKKTGQAWPIFAAHFNGANNSTTFTDNSYVTNKGFTREGGVKLVTDAAFPGGSALSFNGTNDRTYCNLNYTYKLYFADFTLRFLVKATNGGLGTASVPAMCSLGLDQGSTDGFHIYCASPTSAGFYPRVVFYSRTNVVQLDFTSTTQVLSGVVTEIEVSRFFSTTDNLYHYELRINGVSTNSVTSSTGHEITTPYARLYLGGTSHPVTFFNGKIGEVRLWRGWGNSANYTPLHTLSTPAQFSGNGETSEGNNYKYLGALTAFDEVDSGQFGSGLAFYNNQLYVGSLGKNDVYKYDISGESLVYNAKLEKTIVGSGESFGSGVAASESDIFVGAKSYASGQGCVYHYLNTVATVNKYYLFINL